MKKGNAVLIALIVIAILVIAGWLLLAKNQIVPQQTASVPAIQNTNDLNAAAKELDSADLNQMDAAQTQINSDSSNF